MNPLIVLLLLPVAAIVAPLALLSMPFVALAAVAIQGVASPTAKDLRKG